MSSHKYWHIKRFANFFQPIRVYSFIGVSNKVFYATYLKQYLIIEMLY